MRLLVAALLLAGCSSGGARESTPAAPAGIPAGWTARELVDLREGDWRFYRIVDPAARSSVTEDHCVLQGGARRTGEDGLARFLADRRTARAGDAASSARLTAQIAMFFIGGTSRASARFDVLTDGGTFARDYPAHAADFHPPETSGTGAAWVHRAWIGVEVGARHMTVTVAPDGAARIAWIDIPRG